MVLHGKCSEFVFKTTKALYEYLSAAARFIKALSFMLCKL